ncbi:AmmeMemoRadiSam system protein B [candidate division WOR-3 bacterium]|nr:AmmeMemoRadiSam system protein B [candidate division WOR-3 bacterium]
MVTLLISGFILLAGCSSNNIREPAVAGTWYPADKVELQNMIQGFFSNVKEPKIEGKIYGIIAPHAGYVYSGQTAAYAFKQLTGHHYKDIILLGPTHRAFFKGASIYSKGHYHTPLGDIPINEKLAKKIINENKNFSFIEKAHLKEHSLEAELPFLQQVLKDFKIVPIVVGQVTPDICNQLASAIIKHIKGREDVLIVASSDMSHYPNYENACEVDRRTLTSIESLDPKEVIRVSNQQLSQGIPNLNCTLCGKFPVIIAMEIVKALGANKVKTLHYANSGDISIGDKDRVVGYGAVAFCKEGKMEKTEFEPLGESVQKELLKIARLSIESYAKSRKVPEFKPKGTVLNEKRGVFVTLTKNGQLRGCIGHHKADTPLYKLVPKMAFASAFQDSRFLPVSLNELKNIKIKLSVYLCEVHEIDISEFKVGVHGIIMIKDGRGATYLPEVPLEVGWSKEETLAHLCQKAGLPQDAWKEGAKFYVYRTQVFSE